MKGLHRIRLAGSVAEKLLQPLSGLYYCDWFEDYTTDLALAIAAQSQQVSVIVRDSAPEFQGRLGDAKQSRRRLRSGVSSVHVLPGRYWSLRSVKDIRRILRSAPGSGGRFDYFHIQQTGDPRFLWVAIRLPTVLTLHEPGKRPGVTRRLSFRGVLAALVQRAYRYVASVIVVHTAESLESLSPAEKRKSIVLPHGVKLSRQNAVVNPEAKVILFFGRAALYKGIETLIAAMDIVWKSYPDARLRILASRADPECEVAPADPRVTAEWGGYSESELDCALSQAHVVCQPYLTASGSGVGSRAYGAGKLIVASDLEGLRELVSDPELLCQPGDVNDLARALMRALGSSAPRGMSDLSRSWTSLAPTYVSLYQSVVGRSRTGRSLPTSLASRMPRVGRSRSALRRFPSSSE